MATRLRMKQVPTPTVQEGGWIKVTELTMGEAKEAKKRGKGIKAPMAADAMPNGYEEIDTEAQATAWANEVLTRHLVAWNWVDDDGNPLPLPKDNPAVLDTLTVGEFKVIMQAIAGANTAAQVSEKKVP